jgi:hypothetical protein
MRRLERKASTYRKASEWNAQWGEGIARGAREREEEDVHSKRLVVDALRFQKKAERQERIANRLATKRERARARLEKLRKKLGASKRKK